MKLIIAEDDEHGCDVLTRRLQRVGHAVVAATCSSELKEMLVNDSFDAILLAFSPREHNSWKVANEVRERTTAPIIALSSVPFRSDHIAAMKNGCHAYLVKPVDFKELLNTIGRLTSSTPEPVV